jgi:hypothetical protein
LDASLLYHDGSETHYRIVVLLLGTLKMTAEQAIAAYIQLQEYIHPSTSPSSDIERFRNSEAFKEAFIKILKSVDMDETSMMRQTTLEARTGET